ncbi:hypothetical protein [uncultured Sphingomonas sp.]|uniref:hypothetical protein n=1 Tax=uncultured Sphingomonas sp. TaxID=158754 RepID=UPI0035CB1235
MAVKEQDWSSLGRTQALIEQIVGTGWGPPAALKSRPSTTRKTAGSVPALVGCALMAAGLVVGALLRHDAVPSSASVSPVDNPLIVAPPIVTPPTARLPAPVAEAIPSPAIVPDVEPVVLPPRPLPAKRRTRNGVRLAETRPRIQPGAAPVTRHRSGGSSSWILEPLSGAALRAALVEDKRTTERLNRDELGRLDKKR